jgi:CheY-like chemotaxis protein
MEYSKIERKNVLLIDDDLHSAGAVRSALENLGFQVTACANGEESLRCSVDRVFDYIIIDHDMPGMNGLEVARRMRQLFPRAYLIGMSGSDLCDKFLFAGANWFIHKPVTPRKLQPIFGSLSITDAPVST